MKNTSILTLLALTTAFGLHSAAGPEMERSSKEVEEFFNQANAALWTNKPADFLEALAGCPDIVNFSPSPEEPDLGLLCYSASRHAIHNDQAFFLRELLQRGARLTSKSLNMCSSAACTSICFSHEPKTTDLRLNALKTFYGLVSTASLPKELASESIKSPQEWLRDYASRFLTGPECSECGKPRTEHDPINSEYLKRLRTIVQLD